MLNFFKQLFTGARVTHTSSFLEIPVQCNRCKETLVARFNVDNDLSMEYGENGNPSGYVCRKVVMGSGRCYQQVEVRLEFNMKKEITAREIAGGTFIAQ
jgi:hypothetical protein